MASFNRVTMSGSTNLLSVTFPYLDKSHVKVYLNEVLQDPSTYTWPTDSSVALTAGAPAAGTVGEVRRVTPTTALTTFVPGNLDVEDLNVASLQPLYVAEEAREGVYDNIARDWVTNDYGPGGTITKGTQGQMLKFDANGDLVPTSTVPDPSTGEGLMLASVYDPNGAQTDAFALENMTGAVSEDQVGTGVVSDAKVKAGSKLENRIVDTISPFDPEFGASGVGDDLAAIQAAWLEGSTRGVPIIMAHEMDAGGQLVVKQDMTVVGRAGATLYQTGWSEVGGFIVAADPTPNNPATIKSGIHFRDPYISGANNPAPTYFEAAAGSTTTTIVLGTIDKEGNPVSTVDDFYKGRAIIVAEGAASNGVLRFVTDYVGATRTLTLTSALPAAPASGDDVLMGWNDLAIGLGGGVSDITIFGGKLTDYMPLNQVPPPSGAKGVNFEQGTTNALLWGTTFRNLGIAVFVQGLDGAYTTGAKKRTVGIRVGGYHAENVGSVLTVAGVNGTQLPDGDADDQMGLATFITYENAGHKPYRFVGSDQQKSGIIDLLEGQNFSIAHVSGRNDAAYPNTSPGYPTDYPSRVGYGLSGNVGAMIWGHGRNISIDDFKHYGPVDCVWTVRRGRALGDDGQVTSGAGVTGRPGNVLGNRFTNIQLFGMCSRVIEVDPTPTYRVLNEELTGELHCIVEGVTSSIVDPNMSGYTNIIIDVTRRSDGKRVRGTPAQIILAGNQFDLLPEKETILRGGRVYTLLDDDAVRIVPPKKSGFMRWGIANGSGGASNNYGMVHYCIQGGAICNVCFGPATLSVGTTVLTTGTTDGVDANTNVNAVVSDALYLKNRTGVTRTYEVFFD